MKKVKKINKPLIVALCILLAACGLFVISEVTAVRIDDVENYEDIFENVEKLQFYRGDDNFFTTIAPAKKLRSLKAVKISSEPVSEERADVSDSAYKFTVNEKYAVYINEDFSELRINDMTDESKQPSYSYGVKTPGIFRKLFVDTKKYYE
ncbi:MAG: hypothetical protein IJB74_06710 [Clostridia bacterium]|nr:hypothetical protein [Clostridia bacterium]